MLRNLPEGARFSAAVAADRKDDGTPAQALDPRTEAVMDHRTWTLDRRLKAMEINAIYQQVAVSGQWGKNGPPDFPIIGPASWQKPQAPAEPVYTDNFDFFRKMGWPSG